jgi:hypothetical protein
LQVVCCSTKAIRIVHVKGDHHLASLGDVRSHAALLLLGYPKNGKSDILAVMEINRKHFLVLVVTLGDPEFHMRLGEQCFRFDFARMLLSMRE